MLGKKSINMRKQSEKKTSTKNLTHHYYYYYYHFHFSFVSYFMLVLLLRMIFCRLGVWWFALCTCILYVGSIRLSNGPKNILIHTLHTRIKPAKLDIHFIFYGCFIFRFVNLTYFNPFSSFASFRPKCIQEKSYFPWKFITFCVLSFGCVIIPDTTLSMNNTPCHHSYENIKRYQQCLGLRFTISNSTILHHFALELVETCFVVWSVLRLVSFRSYVISIVWLAKRIGRTNFHLCRLGKHKFCIEEIVKSMKLLKNNKEIVYIFMHCSRLWWKVLSGAHSIYSMAWECQMKNTVAVKERGEKIPTTNFQQQHLNEWKTAMRWKQMITIFWLGSIFIAQIWNVRVSRFRHIKR